MVSRRSDFAFTRYIRENYTYDTCAFSKAFFSFSAFFFLHAARGKEFFVIVVFPSWVSCAFVVALGLLLTLSVRGRKEGYQSRRAGLYLDFLLSSDSETEGVLLW